MKKIIQSDAATTLKLIELTPDGVNFTFVVKLPPPDQDQVFSNQAEAEAFYVSALKRLQCQ